MLKIDYFVENYKITRVNSLKLQDLIYFQFENYFQRLQWLNKVE